MKGPSLDTTIKDDSPPRFLAAVKDDPLLSLEEVAAALRCTVRNVHYAIRDSRLSVIKNGRRTLIRNSELHRFINSLPSSTRKVA